MEGGKEPVHGRLKPSEARIVTRDTRLSHHRPRSGAARVVKELEEGRLVRLSHPSSCRSPVSLPYRSPPEAARRA